MFKSSYDSVFAGDANWKGIDSPEGEIYTWDDASTYVKNPPYFEGMTLDPGTRHRDRGRPRACPARRFGDHRPHIACRSDLASG